MGISVVRLLVCMKTKNAREAPTKKFGGKPFDLPHA